jgi:hypothetical protein
MLILALLSLPAHADNCPQYPGVPPLYNSAVNVTITSGSPYHFYSTYNLLGDTLTLRVRPDDAPVALVKGHALECPTYGRDETLISAAPGHLESCSLSVSGELGFELFMVVITGSSANTTNVVISAEGENPNNADVGEWRLLGILYLTMVLLLLVVLFVHAILARGRVHYKVDLSAND